MMPVPFNPDLLELAYGPEKAARLEKKLVETYGAEKKVTILELRKSDDPEIKALADYVYENVFVHYTMKQWGQTPEEIDPNTTARVPVFLSRDDRYFQDTWQGIPAEGYTPVFDHMLDHPNITVELGVDASDRLKLDASGLSLDGEPFTGTVVYTGAVDELFGLLLRPPALPHPGLQVRDPPGGVVPAPGHGELHRQRGLHPHHRVQVFLRPGPARPDHHCQGVLPRLHRRGGGDPLLRHHQ